MRKKRLIIQSLLALLLVWAVVAGIRAAAGSQRVTAEKLEAKLSDIELTDWSDRDSPPEGALAERRDRYIVEVSEMVNRLDFAERQKTRDRRSGEAFFRKLAPNEKERFIGLTIEKSMQTFMTALDGLPAKDRRKFVEDGLREIEDGRTAEEMERARELSEELLARIADEGMKAYFENASADTKLDLAPLMEAMDDLMKGMRGHDFRPRQ